MGERIDENFWCVPKLFERLRTERVPGQKGVLRGIQSTQTLHEYVVWHLSELHCDYPALNKVL